ncbi:MAG: sensor N-terminal transmembrane domain-containing protein, partial [Pseudomonadota bacterium]
MELEKTRLRSPEDSHTEIRVDKVSPDENPPYEEPAGKAPVPDQSPAVSKEAPASNQPSPKKKGLLSRSFKTIRDNLFSSLTRRIVILNMAALAVLLGTILYMNQFREGLIDAKIESLLTQGRIIAGAIAGSATANPDAITIDPERLLELKAGESLQPRLDPLD